MHEIILILFLVAIGAIPTGYFVKHTIADVPEINEPRFERIIQTTNPVADTDAELDMEAFNRLNSDIQDIIRRYV